VLLKNKVYGQIKRKITKALEDRRANVIPMGKKEII
jgi:hypothetical protein